MRRNAFGIFMAILTAAVLLKLAQGPSETSAEPQPVTDPGLIALDALNGYQDVQLGTPPAHNMVFVETFNGVETYRRPSERLAIGKIKLWEVNYKFWHGKLSRIVVRTASSDSSTLRDGLQKEFGPGQTLPDDPQGCKGGHEWRGGVALMEIFPCGRNGVVLTIKSLPIELEKETYETGLEQARKGL